MLRKVRNWFRRKPTPPFETKDLNLYEELDELLKRLTALELELTPGLPGLGTLWSYTSDLGELNLFLQVVNKNLREGVVVDTTLLKQRKEEISLDYFLFTRKGNYSRNQHELVVKLLEQARVYHTFMKDGFSARLGAQEANHRKLYAFTLSLNAVLRALLVYARLLS